jgi:hypothetical protein
LSSGSGLGLISSFKMGEAALVNFGDADKAADVFGILLGHSDELVGGGLQAAHGGLQTMRSVRRSRARSMRSRRSKFGLSVMDGARLYTF